MSDEIKKTVLNTLADPIANSAKNITDKPTQNIGTTLADIWYLVFGGISQAAEKRKLKYSYALQEFEKELKEKISKIPKDKLAEPDIQVIAQALDAAKYCVDKEELRKMFSNLISNSLNNDTQKNIHPVFVNIISRLNPSEAKLLKQLFETGAYSYIIIKNTIEDNDLQQLLTSLSILENVGLIESPIHESITTSAFNKRDSIYRVYVNNNDNTTTENNITVVLSELGILFCKACIDQ